MPETNTETKIAVIETEVKYLKKNIEEIVPKINKMYETFLSGEGKISILNKEVFGNGKPSIRDKFDNIWIKISSLEQEHAVGNTKTVIISSMITGIVVGIIVYIIPKIVN